MAGSRQLHESHLWESSWWTHCPILFFCFAAGHYPPEELVSLGNHGETIFFFEATELVWAIGIFWWPASFFFFGIFWGRAGGPRWGYQRPGKSRPGGRVHSWFRIRLCG